MSRPAIGVDDACFLMVKRMAALEGKKPGDLVRDMVKQRLVTYPEFKRQAVLEGIKSNG